MEKEREREERLGRGNRMAAVPPRPLRGCKEGHSDPPCLGIRVSTPHCTERGAGINTDEEKGGGGALTKASQ